jgi:hypothetical protein
LPINEERCNNAKDYVEKRPGHYHKLVANALIDLVDIAVQKYD